jgi:hypothetical protein
MKEHIETFYGGARTADDVAALVFYEFLADLRDQGILRKIFCANSGEAVEGAV